MSASSILTSSSSSLSDERRTDWRSIYVAASLTFVGSVQFSLYFSSLWSYMRIVDDDITETFYGVTVAAYSLGQIISSPGFGFWSNKIKQVRLPLAVGLILMLTGNSIFILMELFSDSPKRYFLLVGRFITGLGSGNVALLRTYACTASTPNDRQRAIAFVMTGSALGLSLGPVFQLIFSPIEYPGLVLLNALSIHIYTAPAYAAVLMNVLGLLSLYFLFRENYAGVDTEAEKAEDAHLPPKLPKADRVAVFICFLTSFTDMFVRTILETLGSPLAMAMFAISERDAVMYVATGQTIVGILTLVSYTFYLKFNLAERIPLRASNVVALILFGCFFVFTFPYPFYTKRMEVYNSTELAKNETGLGCDIAKLHWCSDAPALEIFHYYTCFALFIGIGFPLLTLTMNALFSQILGPRRQGTQQGILQVFAGVGRLVGPTSGTHLYVTHGQGSAWLLEIAVVGTVIGAWAIFYKRMVPLKVPHHQHAHDGPLAFAPIHDVDLRLKRGSNVSSHTFRDVEKF